MRKIYLSIVSSFIALGLPAMGAANCFVAKEGSQYIYHAGQCAERHPPCSTFKLAISLMAYNEGILKDETHPEWSYKRGYVDWKPSWKEPHNPSSWISDSCVWYSQKITTALGPDKFKHYVQKFHYGNADVSGDKGMHNGVMQAWLSSSLQISPDEQIAFLQNYLAGKLPVSANAQRLTHNIFFVKDMPNGWKLYGKTGTGHQQKADRSIDPYQQVGWFIGWVEKGDKKIVFTNYVEEVYDNEFSAGTTAKDNAIKALEKILKHPLQYNLPQDV